MTNILPVSIFLALAAAGIIIFLWRHKNKRAGPRYAARPLFTKDEEEFYGRLRKALPTCHIFPKVAMSSLLEPVDIDRKRNAEDSQKISRRKLDYAIFDAGLKLSCVIDLNNRIATADGNGVSESDFTDAGIVVIRWPKKNLPTSAQILRTLAPLVNQLVPRQETETIPAKSLEQDTVYMMYQADPVPSNIKGLTFTTLDQLTPHKVLQKNFPHIWQRICQFSIEPKHLQKYLASLSIQDRGENREGFSFDVLREISDIQIANDQFLNNPITVWKTGFVNR